MGSKFKILSHIDLNKIDTTLQDAKLTNVHYWK